jgi:hypothetical protein
MKVTRLYTGPDGQSHFEEIDVEINKLQPGDGIVFRDTTPDHVNGWHRAPRRQYESISQVKLRLKSGMVPSGTSVLATFFWQRTLPVRAISHET